jgi:hypothetical protein
MKRSIRSAVAQVFSFCLGASAQTLTGIESVEYDSSGNRYLISNKTSIIAQSAVNGALSVFGQGAVAEYGMEIMQGVLYAVVAGGVKGYDLATGSQVVNAPIPGGQMLNGMASDGDSLLWVTDTFGKSITQINVKNRQNPAVKKIGSATPGQPNGIYYDKPANRLVFINWGGNVQVNTMNLATNAVASVKTTDRTNCDGITRDKAGNWYISCWQPAPGIFKIAPDFSGAVTAMPGTFANPADIDYNPVADVIAVPNTTGNTIGLIQLDNAVAIRKPAHGSAQPARERLELFQGGQWILNVEAEHPARLYLVNGHALVPSPKSE